MLKGKVEERYMCLQQKTSCVGKMENNKRVVLESVNEVCGKIKGRTGKRRGRTNRELKKRSPAFQENLLKWQRGFARQ